MIRGYNQLAEVLGVSKPRAVTLVKHHGLEASQEERRGGRPIKLWTELEVEQWKARNPQITFVFKASVAIDSTQAKCVINDCDKLVLHASGKCLKHRTTICKCGDRFTHKTFADSMCHKCRIRVKSRDFGSAFNYGGR